MGEIEHINRRYRIQRLLGRGSMGRVHLVSDESEWGKSVALKTLKTDWVTEENVEGLEKEFEILTGLRHPNVQEVYDYGRVEEGPEEDLHRFFFTCEYLEGKDLFQSTEWSSWKDICEYVVQLCRALQFIHSHRLVHYDVKPENVIVTPADPADASGPAGGPAKAPDGILKLVDFGIAGKKQDRADARAKGSIAFAAPEMWRGEPADFRVDLYGLGITLFEVLARELPFEKGSAAELITAHLKEDVPSLRRKRHDVPRALEELVRQLLAKRPGDRPASANEVIRRINRITGIEHDLETKETLAGYVGSGGFVGREEELEGLKRSWTDTAESRKGPRFILVRGEDGIGKRRLVREFRIWAQTQGHAVIDARARESSAEAFGLMQKALQKFSRQAEVWERIGQTEAGLGNRFGPYLEGYLPDFQAPEGTEAPEILPPPQERIRLLDRLSDFVLAGAKERGVILILENLHDGDAMSFEILEFLARKSGLGVEGGKALIVGTLAEAKASESVEAIFGRLERDGHLRAIPLGPLPGHALRKIVMTMFGPKAGDVADRILGAERSGNPFFLEEVLRGWVEEGVLRWRTWGWDVDHEKLEEAEVPGQIRDVVEGRLERLAPGEEAWLEALAVWGGAARREALLRCLGEPLSLKSSAAQSLVQKGLLREEEGEPARIRF
ncbi:MAG: serine/threonine-protein kinase, partial [Planctomycetota bacterium]